MSVRKYSQLRDIILGSDFNSIKKIFALEKIESNQYVSSFFKLHSDIVSNRKNVLSYDLTHSIGNFLNQPEISNHIETTRKKAKTDDFIISRLRSYLKEFAVVQNNQYEQLFSTEYLVYRPISNKLSSNTLLAFSLTKYVQTILNHSQYGTAHPRFFKFAFNELPIPEVLITINKNINGLLKNAYVLRDKSQKIYIEAERVLLEIAGLKSFQLGKEPINIKNFKDSYLVSGRLDAEYYQKKYEDYLNQIYKYSNGYKPLLSSCYIKDSNFNPEDDQGYQYIELSNIGKTGDINGCLTEKGKELPSRARRKVNTGDVIISSIEGSLESCAIITREYDNSLCSTGFYVINSDLINSETLLVLFKSPLMQNILKQACSGTILTAINKTEFQNIPIPIIEAAVQQQISDLVKQSLQLKKQAEHILETAKQAVEIAIEQDEEAGINFINSNLTFNDK